MGYILCNTVIIITVMFRVNIRQHPQRMPHLRVISQTCIVAVVVVVWYYAVVRVSKLIVRLVTCTSSHRVESGVKPSFDAFTRFAPLRSVIIIIIIIRFFLQHHHIEKNPLNLNYAFKRAKEDASLAFAYRWTCLMVLTTKYKNNEGINLLHDILSIIKFLCDE